MFVFIPTQIQCYFVRSADVPIEQKQCNHCWEVFGGRVRRQVKHKQNENAARSWDQVIQLPVERERERESRTVIPTPAVWKKGNTWLRTGPPSHHVPNVVGQPVDDRITAAHELQVLGLGGLLSYQKDHKAGWDKGHRHDDKDSNDHISALETGVKKMNEC